VVYLWGELCISGSESSNRADTVCEAKRLFIVSLRCRLPL